jgi:DNA (cytosine-5)-methyltransferase 1
VVLWFNSLFSGNHCIGQGLLLQLTQEVNMKTTAAVTQYRISDAAVRLGVSSDTIRRWDKMGLIRATRDEHNYRVFNIDELTRVQQKVSGSNRDNNYQILESKHTYQASCIDLFAGAGGTALGFHNAGIRHTLLADINKDAAATLQANSDASKLGWNVFEGDVADICYSSMKADVIQAGFPCQAFSYAGKSLGFEDTRGTLFYEFARAVKEVSPKIAIGENVRGLLSHDNGKTLKTMMGVLDDLGYLTVCRVLRAQYFDVPQKRERLILFAVQKGSGIPAVFPIERDYYISLREALEDCPESDGQKYTERKYNIMKQIPEGGYWRDLPDDLQREYMGASYHLSGGKTGMARRLSWDQPSLTLTCNPAQKQTERCHPSETRPLNIREYARIQTFPDSWVFAGSKASQYRQIGNAVPVHFAQLLGQEMRRLENEVL